MVRGEDARDFYWDGNVAAMSERKTGEESLPILHYYLQDELGSTVRVSGYHADNEKETRADIRYLTYGYDEFGNDLYDDLEESGILNPYSRQGEEQPFGYTGYRYDDISGTYFAQAREYQEKNGRFTAEDVIKGNGVVPETLNRYGYCMANPLILVDNDGKEPIEPTSGTEADYVGVYYLNSEDGAYRFGHAALLLVREDGSGTFYSYAASMSEAFNIVQGKDVPGYLSKAELGSNDVERFMGGSAESSYTVKEIGYVKKEGKIYTDGLDTEEDGLYHDGEGTPYTRAVYIPITAEEGNAMIEYAEGLRTNQMDINNNTNVYNLFSSNCSMIAQDILAAGNKSFAAGSSTSHSWDEQLAMGIAVLAPIMYPMGYAISSNLIIGHIVKDYLDQTIPDGAYYLGYIMAKEFLYEEGWEAGKLETFQGKQYGGCIQ